MQSNAVHVRARQTREEFCAAVGWVHTTRWVTDIHVQLQQKRWGKCNKGFRMYESSGSRKLVYADFQHNSCAAETVSHYHNAAAACCTLLSTCSTAAFHDPLIWCKFINTHCLPFTPHPSTTINRHMGRTAVVTLAVAAAAAAAAALIATFTRRKSSRGPSKKQLDRLETVVLKNRDGVEVHITPVGASIQRFIVPLGQERRDVVLGFNKASTYAVRWGQVLGGQQGGGGRTRRVSSRCWWSISSISSSSGSSSSSRCGSS